jgi:hypothetical protein
MRPTVLVHILLALLGIVSGFVALSTLKGGRRHRRSGMVFVYTMVAMALMGAAMAALRGVSPRANIPAGLLTTYLVLTALITVRPPSARSRWVNPALMLLVLGVALADLTFGLTALASPTDRLHAIRYIPFLVFAAIGLLAFAGDLRMIRAGGPSVLRGAPRLRRHLWRMCFALGIATLSFAAQKRMIPKPLHIVPLLMAPTLIVLVAMFYWLWRVRARRSPRWIVGAASPTPIPEHA